jgi:hypothetical protein
MSPINSLPPEILTHIFACLTEPKRHVANGAMFTPKGNPKEWVPVTHVCQYWRDSAIEYPFMWSPVIFQPEDIKNESSLPYKCLQRSLGASLDVQVKCDASMDNQLWNKLAARCDRLRKFHISDLFDIEQLRCLRHEALLLQSLNIQVSDDLVDQRADGREMPDELPELFAGTTPALRYLTLRFFTKFSTNCFANLSVLHLSDQLYCDASDVDSLLVLLRASPNMEELSLMSCNLKSIDSFASPALAPTDDVFLPMYRLHQLAFVGCHATIMALILSRLELGTDGTGILCKDWMPSDRPLASIFPSKATSRLHPLQDLTALDLTYDTAEATATGPSNALRLVFENDLDVVDGIVPGLRFLLPLHALETLSLAGVELHDAPFWRDTFAALPALRRLVLWLPPTEPVKWLDALRPQGDGPYPAPALGELCVFPPYPDAWDAAVMLAQRRAADGRPLRRLRVMCEEGTRDAAIRRAFEGWKAEATVFDGIVEDVSLESVPRYRQGDVLPEQYRTFIGK